MFQQRKKQLRNDEYNEFLRQKGGKGRGRQTEGRPPLPTSARNPVSKSDIKFKEVGAMTSVKVQCDNLKLKVKVILLST